jgi:hypothetical protein
MTESVSPVRALAQFFDDIRVEATGKLILIGQYYGDMLLPPNLVVPIDRLAALVTMRWPRDHKPNDLSLRIEITGQPTIAQDLAGVPEIDLSDKPVSPFSSITAQGMVHIRFLPLRIGDNIDVWVSADGVDVPAGRLHVGAGAPLVMGPAVPSLTGVTQGSPVVSAT